MWSTLFGAVLGTVWRIYYKSFLAVILVIALLSLGCAIKSGPIVRLHYHLKFTLIFVVSFFCAVFLCPLYLFRPRDVRNSSYPAMFVKIATRALGITVEVRNSKILEEDRGALLTLNHQSALDVILLFLMVPLLKKVTPIIKKELLYLFPYGPCTWVCGAFFVDRSSPKKAYETLNHCAKEMNKKKIKIYIFPEGTRSSERGFLPFKRGAFKTAIMGQVPIIPIVISPYYFIDHQKKLFPDKGHIIIKALEPIPTLGMTDADHVKLMEQTRNVMLEEYHKSADEVDELSLKKEWREKERPRVLYDGKGN